MFLYLSADAAPTFQPRSNEQYCHQGVALNPRKAATVAGSGAGANLPATHCFYPMDLAPYTRKPLFLVVDSDNSDAFKVLLWRIECDGAVIDGVMV